MSPGLACNESTSDVELNIRHDSKITIISSKENRIIKITLIGKGFHSKTFLVLQTVDMEKKLSELAIFVS